MLNFNQILLSNSCKQVLLGALLGDGSLRVQKNYKNARFQMRHSIIQKTYFDWKVSQLNEIAITKAVALQGPDGFSTNKKLHFQSRALESLTTLYKITHHKNKLMIRRKWLNLMNPLALMVWWFDDGSLISGRRQGVICTDSFDINSVKILSRYLKVVWGIETRVRLKSKKIPDQYRLFLNTSETIKFLKIILPCIPKKEMLPKVLISYKDDNIQQRWISEIQKNVSFEITCSDIEQILESIRK
uniref:hypothetical protein n=1 Tax=Symbiochloris sp. SG-2018 TaxID=2126034 RepID=UPI002114C512|nr:hypothetical protein NRL16_pgp038 [Symbiochloris sp. SG-2018]UTQ75732.1 hypothetical protein [Symbiochloris sp. SG-2018]